MTSASKIFCFVLLAALLAGNGLVETEARPFNIMGSGIAGDFFDGLSLGAIKQSGPSPGDGHKFTDVGTLGSIKDSGPSPGVGHGHVTGSHH